MNEEVSAYHKLGMANHALPILCRCVLVAGHRGGVSGRPPRWRGVTRRRLQPVSTRWMRDHQRYLKAMRRTVIRARLVACRIQHETTPGRPPGLAGRLDAR